MMRDSDFKPLVYDYPSIGEVENKINSFHDKMITRRSVRDFSEKPVPKNIVEKIIEIASNAPSGANMQPWTFVAISDPKIKKEIRVAAEKEEFENYNGRMPESWKQDLAHLGTDWEKPFLEKAPWLIVVFKKSYRLSEDNSQLKNYYVSESVGIACGFLISAIHMAGLTTLTHTPSPMNFLQKILNRPDNEKPYLLLPVGYPSENALVPNISKEKLEDISIWFVGRD